jgi:hypothetical protein
MLGIQGTSVRVNCFSFGHKPTQEELAKHKKQQPPLYYAAGEGKSNLASVNAGNSAGLWIGGGGVNLGFDTVLLKTQKGVGDYRDRHSNLLAKADRGGSTWEGYSATDPCAFSWVNPSRVNQIAASNEGVCFVDVFDPNNSQLCPDRNPLNAAMLYVAPPEDTTYLAGGSDHAAAAARFVTAIQATAVNIIKTLSGYNAIAAQHKLLVIEVLRNTLFSSGIYNDNLNVDRDEIARAIFSGFKAELQNAPNSGLVELRFPVGNGELYQDDLFAAVKRDLQQSIGAAAR